MERRRRNPESKIVVNDTARKAKEEFDFGVKRKK